MKFCATCGKILNDSSEEFMVNGILQCESCAYPDSDPIITSTAKSKATWAKILKTVGGIIIFAGIISSLALAACLYNLIYGDVAIFIALIVLVIGVILSVLTSSLLMAFAELAEDVSAIRYIKEHENI